jgi:hypothetical protein
MNFSENIDRWMAIATKHGAVFDNLIFEEVPYGIRVIAADNTKPCLMKVPTAMLIPREGIEITDTDQKVLPEYCENSEIRQLADEMLGFIMSSNRVASHREFCRAWRSFPEALRIRLANMGLAPTLVEDEDIPTNQIKSRLLQARVIKHKNGKTVFMPFVDFINHDSDYGLSYNITDDGLSVEGMASENGELFAVYSGSDTFGLLNTYFYPGKSSFAYSIRFQMMLDDGIKLSINRNFAEFDTAGEGLRLPKADQSDGTLTLTSMWLGSPRVPRRPFWSFLELWQRLGRKDAIRVWSSVCSFNLGKMLELLKLVDMEHETKPSVATSMLKQAIQQHMELLASSLIDECGQTGAK